jgi:hypothetical protein
MENLILIIITLIFVMLLFILKRIERHLTLHGQSLWLIMERLKKEKKTKKNVSKK